MNVRQVPGEPRRRWFADEYFDLIVWLEPDGRVWGFQLCYDRGFKPRALTWTAAGGYKHSGIDEGEPCGGAQKASPVLVEDGRFDARGIAARLEKAATGMPPELAGFVLGKVRGVKS